MSQYTKPCRTCGAINERSAYACVSCGVSLRLSPPKRPAPALSPPVVAPKSSAVNDTLDIETELPDEELDQLLANHTPAPHLDLMDELLTLDEATDGLAPSASFEELEVLAPGTNMPPLSYRQEPSLQDSMKIDPLAELPSHTEIVGNVASARFGLRDILFVLLVAMGGFFVSQYVDFSATNSQGTETVSLEASNELVPSQTDQQQKAQAPFGRVSIRPQIEVLTSGEAQVDSAVLRAQAKAWTRVSIEALKRVRSSQVNGQAQWRLIAALLELAEASRFEESLSKQGLLINERGLVQNADKPYLRYTSEAEALLAKLDHDSHPHIFSLKVWLYSVQDRVTEAGKLIGSAPQTEGYDWTRALPLVSTGEPQSVREAYELLSQGEGCARGIYQLRASEFTDKRGDTSLAYQRFSDCLTRLIAQDHLSQPSIKVKKGATKRSRHANKRSSSTSTSLRGGYQAMMKQGSRALERGRVAQAKAHFKYASSLRPKDPTPIAQLGWCELASGKARSSLKHFKKALSFKSNHADSLYGLGYAYEKMGQWKVARAQFERYLKLYPSGSKVRIINNKLAKMPR